MRHRKGIRLSGARKMTFMVIIWIGLLLAGSSSANDHDIKSGFKHFKDMSAGLRSALGKAESLAATKQFHEALQHLEAFASSNPSVIHPLLYYELGYFHFQSGEPQHAIVQLKKSVELAPDFKNGWQLLAIAWQDYGDTFSRKNTKEKIQAMQNGAMALEKAALLSDSDDLRYQSSILWLEGEKPKKSLLILERLCKNDNPKQEWLVGLSDTLKALKRHEETAVAMEKAAKVQNNPALLFHAAWLWTEMEKHNRARPLLETLAEKREPDKNWLLLLVTVYNNLQQAGKAALVMERVIAIDPAPGFLYNCGLLWLQDSKPERALPPLLRLKEVQPPKTDWFVALAQTWLLKGNIAAAADAMERAANIGHNPEYIYKAGVLRVQLKQADRAIALLTPLVDHLKPKSEWMEALANAWLLKEHYLNAARYMERAAVIADKGKLYHRAAMLWRMEDRYEKAIKLLKKSVGREKVEQLWLIDLASALLDANREREIRPVMERTKLEGTSVASQLRYRGAVIWLNLQEPNKAYPLLKDLCTAKNPKYSWMNSLVKTCVELGKTNEASTTVLKTINAFPEEVKAWKLAVWFALQQGDYTSAVAAKEIVRRFEPNEKKHLKDLSRLYLLAGVPQQSARTFIKTVNPQPTQEEMDQLIAIYLSGQMYEKALNPALNLARQTGSADNWESLGDIYYALRQFRQSVSAYEKAAELNQSPGVFMKAAYAALKDDRLDRAARTFEMAINLSSEQNELVASAMQNLAYIKKRKAYRKDNYTGKADE